MYSNYQYSMPNNYNMPINNKFVQTPSNDRIVGGGFLGPFLLGGITGGLIAPAFYPRPYYRPVYNNFYPYPYYGPYYR